MRGRLALMLLSCFLRAPLGIRIGLRAARPTALRSGTAALAAGGPPPIKAMTVAQLKEELARRGLPVGGRKTELAARLSSQVAPPPRRTAAAQSAAAGATKPKPSTSAAAAAASSKPKKAAGARSATRRARQGTTVKGSGPALMVVESPAKCATIAKFVGDKFRVLACNGHVRSLPSRANAVRPADGFDMEFELVKGAAGVLRTLGAALDGARALYLATDPDREGEAIAWHVAQALEEKGALPPGIPVHRISFSQITRSAVSAALAAPRRLNLPLVHAQQARQAVDYLVGFSLSPVLWRKLPGCRSAGRRAGGGMG